MARRRRRRRLAAYLVAGFVAYTVFGGDQGLVALAMSWRERYALGKEIARLETENRELQARAASLSRDRAYYEKAARERLMLKSPGDLVYRFEKK
jgi:cell division protein FtsB